MAPGSAMLPLPDEEDSTNLLDLLDVVLDQRWVIAAATAVVLALGGAYAFMATPIYEANTLIQVEDIKGGGMGGMLGDTGSMFDIKSPASAEMEILRSRLVVGQAVENLKLNLVVTPSTCPSSAAGWRAVPPSRQSLASWACPVTSLAPKSSRWCSCRCPPRWKASVCR